MAKTYIQQVAIDVLTRAHKIIPTDFPILNRTGKWQLARRAKWIDAYNKFVLKESLIFGIRDADFEEFSAEQYPDHSQYAGKPCFINRNWYYFTTDSLLYTAIDDYILAILTGGNSEFVLGNYVEDNKCLIVRVESKDTYCFVASSPALIRTGTTGVFTIDFEYYNFTEYDPEPITEPSRIDVWLLAYKRESGVLYGYDPNDETWDEDFTNSKFNIFGSTMDIGLNTATFTTANIPDFTEDYELMLVIAELNYVFSEGVLLKSATVRLDSQTQVPGGVKIRTLISETKRKPVEFESKFYNLPDIEGNTSIYASGILATGLDKYVDDVLDTTDSDQIIAPSALEYEGENGTLLVHLSDMVGQQHLTDRWRFDAEIMPSDVTPAATFWATWDDFICESTASS